MSKQMFVLSIEAFGLMPYTRPGKHSQIWYDSKSGPFDLNQWSNFRQSRYPFSSKFDNKNCKK